MAGVHDLPNELILHISTYQSPPDINSFLRTCRHLAGPLAYALLDNVCRSRSSEYGKRALFSAINHGNDTVIKWLLGRKVLEFAANGEILHDAVADQSVRVVSWLLEYGVRADAKGIRTTTTPLAIAAAAGRTDVVRLFLVRDDVDFNALDSWGATPFLRAAACGKEEVVRVMLADGRFEVNRRGRFVPGRPTSNRTPLMAAISEMHLGVVEALLDDNRVDVNARGTGNWTPLLRAVQSGNEEIVRALLDNRRVNVTLWARNQRAIHMAARMGLEGMVRLFLRDNRVEAIMGGRPCTTPFHIVAKRGHGKVLRILLSDKRLDMNKANARGDTPLYLAVRHGHAEIVKILLEDDRVDVNWKDGTSWGLLHKAAAGKKPAIVQLLLAHDKIDVNAGNVDGDTPLHIATKVGSEQSVKLLLSDPRVSVNRLNLGGLSPLHLAARTGRISAVRNLLEHREIDVNSKGRSWGTPTTAEPLGLADPLEGDRSGVTPLHMAAEEGHGGITNLLMDDASSTPLHLAIWAGQTAVVESLLADLRTQLNVKNSQGWTPLHVAVHREQCGIISHLLLDARLNIASEAGPLHETPLHIAAKAGNFRAAGLLTSDPWIDFNQTDINGRTALHHAAMLGHLETAKLLLIDPRCDPSLRDSFGYTPLHLSFLYGEDSVTWLLLKLASPAIEGGGISPPEPLEPERYDAIVQYLATQQDFDLHDLWELRKEILALRASVFDQPKELPPSAPSQDG